MVRAKFVCSTIMTSKFNKDDDGVSKVTLTPVMDGSDENKEFWKWTPSGHIEMDITNEAAVKYFELGEEYYIDFKKA